MAQKGLKMQEIMRKYFNPNKKVEYPKYGLEIWPGFISSVQLINNYVFVNVDVSFKIIRKTNALQAFKDLMQGNFSIYKGGDKERAKDEIIGCTVMTCYN